MNIRAVMAVLGMDDVDHSDKVVLLVVACRAGRYTGVTEVPTRQVAADAKMGYRTAFRALGRLEKAGHLKASRRPGMTTIWTLNPCLLREQPTLAADDMGVVPPKGTTPLPPGGTTKESLDTREGGAVPASIHVVDVAGAEAGNVNGHVKANVNGHVNGGGKRAGESWGEYRERGGK